MLSPDDLPSYQSSYYLAEGTAPLLYAAFIPFALALVFGLYRHFRLLTAAEPPVAGRSQGGREGQGRPPSAGEGVTWLRRLATYGLLQRKVMARRLAGWMHLGISAGFLVLFLGSLLVMVDGHVLKPLGHRLPQGVFYEAFQALLDFFGLALLMGVLLALYRRLSGGPRSPAGDRQALVILSTLLFLGLTGFCLEGLRIGIEGPAATWAFAGRWVAAAADPRLSGLPALVVYKTLWWAHALVAFALVAAIPYTRLRHFFAAPLNIAVSTPHPSAALDFPFILEEVVNSGQFDFEIGAGAVTDFGFRDRLAWAACTDCGRCQEICPAFATGTALSPQRVVGNLWSALQASATERGAGDLFETAVSEDELWSCAFCGACGQSCPVMIDPPRFLIELRRELTSRNRLGAKRVEALSSLARAGNPYGRPHSDRELIAGELGVQTLAENPDVELLYWIGCAATYDPRARAVAKAMVAILQSAGIRFGILGAEERCTGDPARRIGEEGRFQELAYRNLESFDRYRVRRVVTHCAHCFNTFENEYPRLGARFEVIHHTALIDELIERGRIAPSPRTLAAVTLHDACYCCRLNGVADAPRRVLGSLAGVETIEMARSREESFCCGAGGAGYWYDVPREEKMSTARAREAGETGADTLVTECPFCLRMLGDAVTASARDGGMRVQDIAELVAGSLTPPPAIAREE